MIRANNKNGIRGRCGNGQVCGNFNAPGLVSIKLAAILKGMDGYQFIRKVNFKHAGLKGFSEISLSSFLINQSLW
jgi:hypothetical protein